jgi:hypothetical protein
MENAPILRNINRLNKKSLISILEILSKYDSRFANRKVGSIHIKYYDDHIIEIYEMDGRSLQVDTFNPQCDPMIAFDEVVSYLRSKKLDEIF